MTADPGKKTRAGILRRTIFPFRPRFDRIIRRCLKKNPEPSASNPLAISPSRSARSLGFVTSGASKNRSRTKEGALSQGGRPSGACWQPHSSPLSWPAKSPGSSPVCPAPAVADGVRHLSVPAEVTEPHGAIDRRLRWLAFVAPRRRLRQSDDLRSAHRLARQNIAPAGNRRCQLPLLVSRRRHSTGFFRQRQI